MTTLADPRNYVESKPVSAFSHKGLRIAARSATVYTCNVPNRREVAKQNYLRRSYQMKSCGYNSITYKPYETVGKVYLDPQNLILTALGQEKDVEQNQEACKVDYQTFTKRKADPPENDKKEFDEENINPATVETLPQYLSSKSSEKLENIQTHLSKGRKLVNAVRLGCNLFHLIKQEQKRIADEAEMERQRKLEASRQSMEILSTSSCSDDSDNEQLVEIKVTVDEEIDEGKSYQVNVSSPDQSEETEDRSQNLNNEGTSQDENHLNMSGLSRNSGSAISVASSEKLSPRLRRKLRSSIRPYSAVYSNINYPELGTRESLFRQLCALNWILDAMSQDTFPPVVTPLTNCWNIRELRLDVRSSRKKLERERQTESNWQTFLVNPGRFSQRETRRGITRRISVHPQHLQRLSAVTSSSSARGNLEPRPRRGSGASTNPETFATEITTDDSEAQCFSLTDEAKKTSRTTKFSEKLRDHSSALRSSSVGISKSFSTVVNAAYAEEKRSRERRLSQKHLNQLSSSSDGPDNPSKNTDSRVNAWVRQTGQGNSKTKFFTAALAAFGAITVNNTIEEVPSEMRRRFSEITEEKKIMLSDKLEVQNRKRWETLRRKFVTLDHSLHVHEALDKMRNDFSLVEPETREEMRQRVSEECKWYKDLIDTFPEEIKCDRYISFVLNKIARYGSLEGRKISVSHFLKVMATLRPWELCYPEIAAAIEFVRENIVGFSTTEYDDWLSSQKHAQKTTNY